MEPDHHQNLLGDEEICTLLIINPPWPLHHVKNDTNIVSCKTCAYPLTFEEHILKRIADAQHTFALIIPFTKIIRTIIAPQQTFDRTDQTKNLMECPNCSTDLSISDSFSPDSSTHNEYLKIREMPPSDEQIIFLNARSLQIDSYTKTYNRFLRRL